MDNDRDNSVFPIIPSNAGICVSHKHFKGLIGEKWDVGFLEIRVDDLINSGFGLYTLDRLKDRYPFSINISGFGLHTGRYEVLAKLQQLKTLIDKTPPLYISQRISLAVFEESYVTDVLSFPYNKKTLSRLRDHISHIQDYLSCQVLIENPLSYVSFNGDMSEPEFLTRLVESTSCNLLLNISNIYINGYNNGFIPQEYIDLISANIIKGLKLSGHTEPFGKGRCPILDSGNNPVGDKVWQLYSYTLSEKGYSPTSIEWSFNLPNLVDLATESHKCDKIINYHRYQDAA